MRLRFPGGATATLDVAQAGAPPLTPAVGLDGRYRFIPGKDGFPLGLRGSWLDAQTFALDYNTIANNAADTLRLRFTGSVVSVAATDRTTGATLALTGTATP